MIRYVFLLLLIDTYGRGLGTPVHDASNGINLANSLEELANYCANPFLAAQIKGQLKNCNLPMRPPYKYKHFQCLFFYDINKQLCSATASANVSPNEAEYRAKLKEKITIADICFNVSKSWDTQDLPNFPVYKASIPIILHNDVKCGQLCSIPEMFTEEVNFYCKYFNWGSELLHSHVVPVQTVEVSNVAQEHKIDSSATALENILPQDPEVIPTDLKPTLASDQQLTEGKAPGSGVEAFNPDMNKSVDKGAQEPNAEPVREVETKPEVINQAISGNSQPLKLDATKVFENNAEENANEDIQILRKTEKNKLEISPSTNEEAFNYNNNGEVEEEPPKKGEELGLDTVQEKASSKVPVDVKPSVIDSPDAKKISPQDPDDYQDADEDKDDIEEGEVVDRAPAPVVPKQYQQTRPADKRFKAPVGDVSEQELFPPMDGFSEDDGDTFFPFFLTAIILVVVLYVLYHNKSKVSKLVLGLIVEGRQTNRRRNSRGHSYRRLDTLEQAMSTTTATAPSKIIY